MEVPPPAPPTSLWGESFRRGSAVGGHFGKESRDGAQGVQRGRGRVQGRRRGLARAGVGVLDVVPQGDEGGEGDARNALPQPNDRGGAVDFPRVNSDGRGGVEKRVDATVVGVFELTSMRWSQPVQKTFETVRVERRKRGRKSTGPGVLDERQSAHEDGDESVHGAYKGKRVHHDEGR